jgi:hypothetical protein
MKRQLIEEEGRLRREDFTEEWIARLIEEAELPEGFIVLDQETREAGRAATRRAPICGCSVTARSCGIRRFATPSGAPA